jgi:hypothetical protein
VLENYGSSFTGVLAFLFTKVRVLSFRRLILHDYSSVSRLYPTHKLLQFNRCKKNGGSLQSTGKQSLCGLPP